MGLVLDNNLSLLIHEIDNETWVKARLFVFESMLSVHFSGDGIFYFSKTRNLPLERVELISLLRFSSRFLCAKTFIF